ncbi:MAG: hypothetical protein KDC46_10705 [Thermoleophilia bacterium]|nr:hypothetical protein [Thermoleophilia bacterium]
MGLSLSTISQGAMTAAVTLGSTLQSLGTGVATAASTAAATAATTATTAATTATTAATSVTAAAATVTAGGVQALPATVQAGATGSAQLANNLALIEKPAKAMATAAPRVSTLGRVAGFLGKALPLVTIGAGVMAGATIVDEQGVGALVTSKDGRGAMLGTLGGALLLVPHPATQIAAAGVLAGVAVNQFGGLDRLDDVKLGAAHVVQA